jgi:hypothetical protein
MALTPSVNHWWHTPLYVASRGLTTSPMPYRDRQIEIWPGGEWPGAGTVESPVFYAYAVPEPAGFAEAAIRPSQAFRSRELSEFLLPYDAVRAAASPREMLLEFMESTYAAGAELGHWDRSALERT